MSPAVRGLVPLDRGLPILFTAGLGFAVLLSVPWSAQNRTLVSDSILLLGAGLATAALAWKARSGDRARAWTLLCAGAAAFTAAEAYWFLFDAVLQRPVPMVSVADASYVLGYAFFLAALTSFFPEREGHTDRLRHATDAIVLASTLLGIAWILFLRDAATESTGAALVATAYPVLDLTLAAILLPLLLEARPDDRRPILLVGLGLLSWAAVDIPYAKPAARSGIAFELPLEALWLVGFLAFALAATVRYRPTNAEPARGASHRLANLLYLPVLAFLTVTALHYAQRRTIDPVQFVISFSLIAALVLRQVLFSTQLLVSNRDLTRRTRDLREAQAIAVLGSWEMDPQTGVVTASDEARRILHAPTHGPLRPTALIDAVHPNDRERVVLARNAAFHNNDTYAVQYRLRLPDGSLRHVAERGRYTEGSKVRLVGTVQDVTERHDTRKHLHFQAGLLETVGQAVFATDLEGRVLYWNPAAERLYGWHRDEVMGRRTADVLGAQQTRESRDDADDVAGPTSGDYWMGRRDGSQILVNLATSPMLDPDGTLTGFIAISYDVTRQRARQARYRALVENSPDGIIRTTVEGRIEYANPAAASILGFDDPASMAAEQTDITELYNDPADRTRLLQEVERERPRPVRALMRRRDGDTVWVEIRARKHAGPDGDRIEAFFHDLSHERARQELTDRLAAIVEASDEALYSMDLDGIVQTWNPAAQRLYGVPGDQAVGSSFSDLVVPEDRRGDFQTWLQRIRDGRNVPRHDNVHRRNDGTLLEVSVAVVPLRDASGDLVGASVSAYDISDRKHAEEAERSRIENEHLRKMDRTLRDFINTAAHDLSQPLTPMRLALATIERTQIPEGAGRAIDMMKRSVDRMAMLLQDLLDVARLDAGHMQFDMVPVDLGALLDETVEFLDEQARAAGVEVRARTDGAPAAHADERRVFQVLFNLVGNAIKFTPPGGSITVDATRQGSMALVRVQDDGTGLTQEQQQALFQPFSQVHAALPQAPKGTGLGLYICKGIVAEHGGNVGVESAGPGKGSTFWFTLPLAEAHSTTGRIRKTPSRPKPRRH